METILSNGKTLEIEKNLNITVYLPQICYFCGEEITQFGRESDSLCFHSLDGDHSNWDSSNKVPCHKRCHTCHHSKKETDPERVEKIRLSLIGREVSDETRRKISNSNKGKPHPWQVGDKNPMRRPEVATKMSEILTGRTFSKEHKEKLKIAFKGLREGPKNPMYGKHHSEETKRKIGAANSGPEINRKAWETRRRLYGPSGRKQ